MYLSGTINTPNLTNDSGGTINLIGVLGGTIPELDNSGTLNLGGFGLTIPTIKLTGGTLENGQLFGAITSSEGTLDGIGGSATVTANSGTTSLLRE